MRVVRVTFSHDNARAIVELRPSWLGRLFGATAMQVELVRHYSGWTTLHTDTALSRVAYGRKIQRALDFVPIKIDDVDLPSAIVIRREP